MFAKLSKFSLNLINYIDFDRELFAESTSSVLITVLGMIFTTHIFKIALLNKKISLLPFIFQSSSILNLKNNLELSFAMYMTCVKSSQFTGSYKRFLFFNSCLVIVKSFLVGSFIGIVGIFVLYFSKQSKTSMALNIIYTSVLSCFFSTVVFVITLLLILKIIETLNINCENFVMPILSAFNDIFVAKILVFVTLGSFNYPSCQLLFILFLIFCLTSVCLFFMLRFQGYKIPSQSLKLIIFVFTVNSVIGVIMERLFAKFPSINPLYHVFSTISGSITYIFAHKINNIIKIDQIFDKSVNVTLSFSAAICFLIYIIANYVSGLGFTLAFLIVLAIALTFQVFALNYIIEHIVLTLEVDNVLFSSTLLPLIVTCSDLLSLLSLIVVLYITLLFSNAIF